MEGSSDSNVIESIIHKEKLPKRVKANEREEIITSKLPESLITHILSFLPAKDAVRTSVLSKKWIHLWTSITKLVLDDSVFYSSKRKTSAKQHFANFVYRVLLLNNSPSIESFSLVITCKYGVSMFNTWMSGILKRNVKILHVCSHFEVDLNTYASYSLFECKVLEELVLKMISIIRVPPIAFVHFGNLKFLKLSSTAFVLDSSSSSEDLTISLPVLKVFETIHCSWLNVNSVTLRAPLLESVLIEHDPNVTFYEMDLSIKISASRLTKFTFCCYGFISQHVALLDPLSAQNAFANIVLSRCEDHSISETRSNASLLLRQFSEVKYLKFDGSEVLPLSESNVAILPVYRMLSHLELGLVTAEFLFALLLRSPVLKSLAFKGIIKFENEILNSATVPHCMTSTLQLVKFGNVHGLEHELCLAKFVMENGLVMQRMSFSLASPELAQSKIIEDFKEKLFSFKKSFSFAIVEFSCD